MITRRSIILSRLTWIASNRPIEATRLDIQGRKRREMVFLEVMQGRIDIQGDNASIVSLRRRGTSFPRIPVVPARASIARRCSPGLAGRIFPRSRPDRHEPVLVDPTCPGATARRSAPAPSDGGGSSVGRRAACRRALAGGSIGGARRSRPATRATIPRWFVGCHSMRGGGVARGPGIGAGSIRGWARSRRSGDAGNPPGRGLGRVLPLYARVICR